jgi:ribonuclease HII
LPGHRIGIDENGLGARLGPLVVTGVLARVTESGARLLSRKPPPRLREDLGDSKRLVSHGDVALGEAWARALVPGADTPADLFERLSHDGREVLTSRCPSHVEAQCWGPTAERFEAEDETLARLGKHLSWWTERGVHVEAVRSVVRCTDRLNRDRAQGKNRFVSDLHAMEELMLSLRDRAGGSVLAVCGKVGGMDDYSRFFGPLSGRLHTELERGKALSSYYFPGLGEVRFLRDADGKDTLVMLASLVGKYVRELLMDRISRHYGEATSDARVSGYHDPATSRFVLATELVRRSRRVPASCFERARDEA